MHDPYAPPMAPADPAGRASPGRLVRIAVGLYVASFVLTLPSAAAMLLWGTGGVGHLFEVPAVDPGGGKHL